MIVPSQWCRSARKRTSSRESNVYSETVKDKAKILLDLLSSEKKELIDSKTEQTYFRSLIFPQDYGFELDEDGKGCNVINKNTNLQTSIIKTSDGIIEAKHLCLLLSHKSYQTIFLQSPEKGKHPPMIERLRDLVLRRIKDKVIVVSSHHQSIITSWTIPRTFACRFMTRSSEDEQSETSVVSCKDVPPYSLTEDEMKKVPFSAHALFMEGQSDKKLIRALLFRLQQQMCDQKECDIMKCIKDKEFFCNLITMLSIVSQGGANHHYKTHRMCSMLVYRVSTSMTKMCSY